MIITNLLYILQAENYEIKRFLKFSYTHLRWWDLSKRKGIDWTKKARLIHALSFAGLSTIIFVLIWNLGIYGAIYSLLLLPIIPLIIALALIFIYPLDRHLKKIIIRKAKNLIDSLKGKLIVIGITGSYGKTSTKEILASILREKYRVAFTTGNINTDIGVADFILKNKSLISGSEIFVVEMGAYRQDEIRKICDIVRPEYSITTGINESHLEKFGKLMTTIETKFELAEATEKDSILNINDVNIRSNYDKFKIRNPITSLPEVREVKELEKLQGLEFKIGESLFRTKLLARHNIDLIQLCSALALKLGLNIGNMVSGVRKVEYIKHRLEPIYNSSSDIWVIDDSYNGNLEGFKSGLEVLNRALGRKIVLTPGLVEQGEKEREIHEKIGEMYLVNKIDLVLLIKNKASDYIANVFQKNNFTNYKIYNSTIEAHNDLGNILKSGDTIIFQNDWPDNYF